MASGDSRPTWRFCLRETHARKVWRRTKSGPPPYITQTETRNRATKYELHRRASRFVSSHAGKAATHARSAPDAVRLGAALGSIVPFGRGSWVPTCPINVQPLDIKRGMALSGPLQSTPARPLGRPAEPLAHVYLARTPGPPHKAHRPLQSGTVPLVLCCCNP